MSRAPTTVGRAVPWTALLLLAWSATWAAGAESVGNPTQEVHAPFLKLRDGTLEYRGPETEEGEPAETGPVKIAWFAPFEGTNRHTTGLWTAAQLAVEEANAAGGHRGRPFQLLPRWTADPWGSGVVQLTRLVYDERPVAVLGSADSASTHLAEQVVAKAQLPLLSPVATDKSATLAGVPWIYACAPSDAAIARVLVSGLIEALEAAPGRLAVLSGTDHESRMTAREVLRALSARHRTPDYRFEAPTGGAGDSQPLAALAEARPRVVFLVGSVEDSARWVKALRARVPTAKLFGTQACGRTRFAELAGADAKGVVFPVLFAPVGTDPVTARFMQEFQRRQGTPPDWAEAMTYDTTRLLIEAVRHGGCNRARVRSALRELSPWSGVAGAVQFDGTGQNLRTNLSLGEIRQGTVAFRQGAAPAAQPEPGGR